MSERIHKVGGFHDGSLICKATGRYVVLIVKDILAPPVPGDVASVAVVKPNEEVEVIGETNAWNFPQGARQQWISPDSVMFNIQLGDRWGASRFNISDGKSEIYDQAVYAFDPFRNVGYGLNFARLHRLGGYGYLGLEDPTRDECAPQKDGIWRVNIETKRVDLLISIADVVACSGSSRVSKDDQHYLTHVVPSPDGGKLAFLHRFWLSDGGIQTRLMVCNYDGTSLECWADGFLSHFDWADSESILIWGRIGGALQTIRSGRLVRAPILGKLIAVAKPAIRKLLFKKGVLDANYNLLRGQGGRINRGIVGRSTLTEDGHPSFCPTNRSLFVSDTYPDGEGWRELFVYDTEREEKHVLGRYRQLQAKPNASQLALATQGIDARVLKAFSSTHFAYSRSGIHCDLHPRWHWDGEAISFDSNHDGYRNVYTIDTTSKPFFLRRA